MNRQQMRLAQLEVAAQEATSRDDAEMILAEEAAMHEVIRPSLLDQVATDTIRVALNPDRLRALLQMMETDRPGTISRMDEHLRVLARNL